MTSEAARNAAASRLLSMGRKHYSDWDATFVAPLSATVPQEMGGLRLDQALARLFHQYPGSRLQAWLRPGHIRVDGRAPPARMAVSGGEQILLTPPRLPDSGAPRAQRMPLKIVHEDAALIVIDKPAGLVVHPGAGQPDRTLLNALLAHAPALAGVPRAGIVHRLDKDRKSTRLNSSHVRISYAVFCLKKKKRHCKHLIGTLMPFSK